MVGLLDIYPQTRKIKVGTAQDGSDQELEIRGLSGEIIARLLSRYPDLLALFSGTRPDAAKFIQTAPGLMAAVIAAACGFPDDPEQEKAAANLPLRLQSDIISEIGKDTFPGGGLGPFVGLIQALSSSGSAPSSAARSQSLNGGAQDGRDQATTSQSPSPPSADTATQASGS